MCHRQTGRQIDGLMNRTDFIGPLLQRWRLDHVIQKFENKTLLDYLTWLWVIWKESIKNKRNTINIVTCSNNLPSQIYVRWFSYYLNVTDPLINPLIFTSFCYCERVHDNKEFSHWNSKPRVMNPKSRAVKSNAEQFLLSTFQNSMTKFFKLKEKPYFGVIFAWWEFFLKNLV